MDALTLLVVDQSADFRLILSLILQDSYYVRTCCSGTQALKLLRRFPVHILVMNLMLPELDGLTLLETLLQEGICPMVLVIAPDFPPEAVRVLSTLDGCGFLRKPCRPSAIVSQVERLRKYAESHGMLQRRARQLLLQLRISPRLDGYDYLLHALPLVVKDPQMTFTKHLYPDVGKAYNCTASLVERSIRHAIRTTWAHHRSDWERFFPNHSKCPSNGELIQTIATELRKNLE